MARVVNSEGSRVAFCTSLCLENERDRFDTVGGLAPILLAAACAFSVKQTQRSYRTKRSNVKRHVKRFTVNVCRRFRCHPMILSIIDVTATTSDVLEASEMKRQ
jgi:hypothetical protein